MEENRHDAADERQADQGGRDDSAEHGGTTTEDLVREQGEDSGDEPES